MSSHSSLLHLLSQSRPKKNRRSHKKSRNGCTECKRRHIRCDERRPACANCAVADLPCSFPKPAAVDAAASHARPSSTASFTSTHIKLLHHLETNGAQLFMSLDMPEASTLILDTAVNYIDDAPYLIDEVLALAAVHLAGASTGGNAASLAQVATELQTRAISAFTQSLSLPPDAEAVPKFLFAAMLSLHDLADTMSLARQPDEPLDSVLDRLVRCFKLYQGMRSAVISPVWDKLVVSELRPLIMRDGSQGSPDDPTLLTSPFRPQDTASASTALAHADFAALDALGEAVQHSSAATSNAVAKLRWSFQGCHQSRESRSRVVSAFCVTLSPEFNDLLVDMVPEAVAIVAYFALLIHRSASSGWWVTGDGAAAAIVTKVASYLGESWSHLMAWPLETIFRDTHDADAPDKG